MESEHLAAVFLPELGSKLVSLKDKETGRELFFQRKVEQLVLPEPRDSFLNYDVSGFDEMFPTIDPCIYPVSGVYQGRQLPDHGEVWYLPWDVLIMGEEVRLRVEGELLPYTLEKRISFKDSHTLRIDYLLTNLGEEEFSYIWAMHGLVQCEPNLELMLPADVTQVVNVFESKVLGVRGAVHPYPLTLDLQGNPYRLDRIQPETARKVEKWYVVDRLISGRVGVYYPGSGLLYQVEYPVEKIPYLGFYVTEGGGGIGADYNCALEPCTGYYDSLELAYQNKQVSSLLSRESEEWYLEIFWGQKSLRE